MSILPKIWNTVIDAIFPRSSIEKGLFSYSPDQAYSVLPRAPKLSFPHMRSVFAYKDERVKDLVWNIKYKKSKPMVAIGGYALYHELIGLDVNKVGTVYDTNKQKPIVMSMPITPRRRRERGFNQCELLVDEIARLDIEHKFIINKNLLLRIHHTSRQTLKDRKERLESAKGIFSVNTNDWPKYLPIVVIDDVITTGSTMKEAIESLQNYGFENVSGLALAH